LILAIAGKILIQYIGRHRTAMVTIRRFTEASPLRGFYWYTHLRAGHSRASGGQYTVTASLNTVFANLHMHAR